MSHWSRALLWILAAGVVSTSAARGANARMAAKADPGLRSARPATVQVLPTKADRADTTVVWSTDLEGNTDEWSLEEGWSITTSDYSSPTHSATIDDNNYGTIRSIVSPSFALPELSSENETISFDFMLNCNFPDFDGDGDNFLEDYYTVYIADMSAIPWHTSTFNAYDGQSWWCGSEDLDGYDNGWLQFLDSPTFSVPASGSTNLTFNLRYVLEEYTGAPTVIQGCSINGWDAANVRISRDGGATWTVLTGTPSYTYSSCYGWVYNGEACTQAGWGNTSSGWTNGSFNLSGYAGDTVILRFAFGSDPAWATADDPALIGFFLDNILVSNSESGTLLSDNADDQVVMSPTGILWNDLFYDYGDVTRPGGAGWDRYNPGDEFNGSLDLTALAGSEVALRWTALLDDNDDGGNGSGLFIDDVSVWKVTLETELPKPQNVVATGGDGVVHLSWDPVSGGGQSGEIAHDNDDGSGSSFTNGIYTQTGTFEAAEYFDAAFGAVVTQAKIFGYADNTTTSTTLSGYNAIGGTITGNAVYEKSIALTTGQWNTIDLSADNWAFSGDFALAMEAGTFTGGIIYAPLDESAIPSTNSYVNLGGWSTWQDVAAANGLPDGEWGIRAVVEASGGGDVVYNVYRHGVGGSFGNPLWYGTAWPSTSFDDYFVVNGQTYYYAVTAVYDYGTPDQAESDFSATVSSTPESASVYEMSYDDGSAETGATSLGEGGQYAVRFTSTTSPVEIQSVKCYAIAGGSAVTIQVADDNGVGGMPGTVFGSFATSSLSAGWNLVDVSSAHLTIHGGSFWVIWNEASGSPQLGLDLSTAGSGNSYFTIPGDSWYAISDLGYNGDLMIRAKVDAAAGTSPEVPLPTAFDLKQNYPNPFNPTTTIAFDLPVAGPVRLTVVDVQGREVAVVREGWMEAGRHSAEVDGRGLSAGIYLYRLEAERFSASKKFVCLK